MKLQGRSLAAIYLGAGLFQPCFAQAGLAALLAGYYGLITVFFVVKL